MALAKIFVAIVINVVMADYHAYLIIKGKRIFHGLWSMVYFGLVCLIWTNPIYLINCLFIRKFFFDTALNYFRGFNFFHVSTKTTSLIDKLHFKLFGTKSEVYQTTYFIIFVLLSCYLMIKY